MCLAYCIVYKKALKKRKDKNSCQRPVAVEGSQHQHPTTTLMLELPLTMLLAAVAVDGAVALAAAVVAVAAADAAVAVVVAAVAVAVAAAAAALAVAVASAAETDAAALLASPRWFLQDQKIAHFCCQACFPAHKNLSYHSWNRTQLTGCRLAYSVHGI